MLNLTIRQLRVFVSVIDAGGFGLAADQLAIAQTSVSAHIQAIEEQLGRTVFVRRSGRRPVLTDFGDMLLSHARTILAEVDALMSQLDSRSDRFAEHIVFACQRSIAHAILPARLARFTQEHPAVELITRVCSQEEVIDQVVNGVAHLGCLISDEPPAAIASQMLGSERYVLIANPDHPLAKRESVRPEEIEPFSLVWPPQTSQFGKSLARILRDAGVRRMTIAARATDYEVFRQLVIAGIGISCSAEKSVAPDVAAGHVVILPLDAPPLTMQVYLIVSKLKKTSPEVHRFLEQIRGQWAPALRPSAPERGRAIRPAV